MKAGKMLFGATTSGAVRTYKLPLSGDYSELRSHSGAITAMRVFFDESVLFTAADDGSVFVYNVRQEVKGALGRRDLEKLPFADEVMVSKGDLEEKRARCISSLRTSFVCCFLDPSNAFL
jgi:cilia- and flagella-associated protein 57